MSAYIGTLRDKVPVKKLKRNSRLRTVDGVDQRQCDYCQEWKTMDNYAMRRQMGPNGYGKVGTQSRCRACYALDYQKRKKRGRV